MLGSICSLVVIFAMILSAMLVLDLVLDGIVTNKDVIANLLKTILIFTAIAIGGLKLWLFIIIILATCFIIDLLLSKIMKTQKIIWVSAKILKRTIESMRNEEEDNDVVDG